ncbi:unnamed protein product [Amoebophrya sp. A25]|nr:unnamed protein product [Amoebophrya sp. A25]|eukprot:GSA25T00007227001.1
MAQFKAIPIMAPHTYATNMGPGSEHGGPYYPNGNQYHQPDLLAKQLHREASLGRDTVTYHLPTDKRLKDADPKSGLRDQCTMYTYGQPDSHRSCVTSFNKDGLSMNSLSHYNKIGAKHMQDQNRSSPIHAYFNEARRKVPDINTKVWDCGIISPNKASSEAIGNWSPLWYRGVNELNVYGKYRDATMEKLGMEYENPVKYGNINGEYMPAVKKVNDSARSTAWSENHKYATVYPFSQENISIPYAGLQSGQDSDAKLLDRRESLTSSKNAHAANNVVKREIMKRSVSHDDFRNQIILADAVTGRMQRGGGQSSTSVSPKNRSPSSGMKNRSPSNKMLNKAAGRYDNDQGYHGSYGMPPLDHVSVKGMHDVVTSVDMQNASPHMKSYLSRRSMSASPPRRSGFQQVGPAASRRTIYAGAGSSPMNILQPAPVVHIKTGHELASPIMDPSLPSANLLRSSYSGANTFSGTATYGSPTRGATDNGARGSNNLNFQFGSIDASARRNSNTMSARGHSKGQLY